jgi:Fe-S cluster biogenesis protein NfuA
MDDSLREGRSEINAAGPPPKPEEVRAALDVLRPGLLADGGNVELVSVDDDGTVHVALQGACADCPAQEMTLRHVLEPQLRERLRGVTGLVVS